MEAPASCGLGSIRARAQFVGSFLPKTCAAHYLQPGLPNEPEKANGPLFLPRVWLRLALIFAPPMGISFWGNICGEARLSTSFTIFGKTSKCNT